MGRYVPPQFDHFRARLQFPNAADFPSPISFTEHTRSVFRQAYHIPSSSRLLHTSPISSLEQETPYSAQRDFLENQYLNMDSSDYHHHVQNTRPPINASNTILNTMGQRGRRDGDRGENGGGGEYEGGWGRVGGGGGGWGGG